MSCHHRSRQDWIDLLQSGRQPWNDARQQDHCRLDLSNIVLTGKPKQPLDFRGFKLHDINFSGSTWNHVRVDGLNFTDSDLSESTFDRVRFTHCSFANVQVTRSVFPECDFSNADLSASIGLINKQLSRTNLTRARLPDGVLPDFLGIVDERIAKAARFFALLLTVILYTWFAIQLKDIQLILGSEEIGLPIIGAKVSVSQLFLVGPILLLTLQVCFFFVLFRVWEAIDWLPSGFPDGFTRKEKINPWLPISFVVNQSSHRWRCLVAWLGYSIFLSLPSLMMFGFWFYYLRRHHLSFSHYHITLFAFSLILSIFFFSRSFWLFSFNLSKTKKQIFLFIFGNAFSLVLVILLFFNLRSITRRVNQSPEKLDLLTNIAYVDLTLENLVKKPKTWHLKLPDEKVKAYRELEPSNLPNIDLNVNHGNADYLFLAKANLKSASFIKTSIKGAVFRGLKLPEDQRALFSHADAQAADFHHADLPYASFDNTNLESATFSDNNLSFADFSAARLTKTHFLGKGTSLVEANFSGAHFKGTLFQEVNLSKAIFVDITITEPIQFERVDLSGSIWIGTSSPSRYISGQPFKNLKMVGADFSKNTFIGCNFTNSILEKADFSSCKLFSCNFSGAILRRAIFTNCNLSDSILLNAKLDGARLEGADLSQCRGLTREQLAKAYIDWDTRLPERLQTMLKKISGGFPDFRAEDETP